MSRDDLRQPDTSATDHCDAGCPLARRAFISQTLLAAAAAALAACGAGGAGCDSLTAPNSIGSSISLASYPTLASTGGIAIVSLSGTRLAVVRTGTSSFLALSLVCPHE